MEHSDPDKPSTKQQIPDANKNSHREIINTDVGKMIGQEQKQQSKNDRHTTYERTNNRILAGILVVTFVYAVFSGLQWNIMRSSMQLDQRAWVNFDRAEVKQFKIGEQSIVSIIFKNYGKTPAKIVAVNPVIEVIAQETSPNFAKENYAIKTTPAILAPQQTMAIYLKDKSILSDYNFKNITTGKDLIYIHGIIKYVDIIGNHHWTTYCMVLDYRDMKTWSPYKDHNDTDDN